MKACTDRTVVARATPDADGNVTFKVKTPTDVSLVFYRLDGAVGALDGGNDIETNSLFYGIGL